MPTSRVGSMMAPEPQQEPAIDFIRFCQPFLKSFNLIGIPLQINREINDNRFRFWIIHLTGWLLFFANVMSSLGSIYSESTKQITQINVNQSTAWHWNSAISQYNGICSTIATQTVFLAVTAVRWKDFANVIIRIERTKQISSEGVRKIETIFKIGLFTTILCYIVVGSFSLSVFLLNLTWWQNLIYFAQRFMILYLILAKISFCCFGWMASTMLRTLGQQMELKSIRFPDNHGRNNLEQLDRIITRWNRHYLLIVDFNQQLNRCFGSLILVLVAPAFVRIINTSFYLMMEFKTAGQFSIHGMVMLTILVVNFVAFAVLVNIPHKIHEEAVNLTRKLRRLQFDDFFIQNKVNVLSMEISNSLPKISAAGFFEVNLQLIPTLIGTTLTYLIILFQFQTSEQ